MIYLHTVLLQRSYTAVRDIETFERPHVTDSNYQPPLESFSEEYVPSIQHASSVNHRSVLFLQMSA